MMNEIERAIRSCENQIRKYQNRLSGADFHRSSTMNAVDLERVKIQALREKAERDNPQPLTLEQLRERGGKPVWLHTFSSKSKNTYISEWALIAGITETLVFFVRVGVAGKKEKWIKDYGKTWVAYRYKPVKE